MTSGSGLRTDTEGFLGGFWTEETLIENLIDSSFGPEEQSQIKCSFEFDHNRNRWSSLRRAGRLATFCKGEVLQTNLNETLNEIFEWQKQVITWRTSHNSAQIRSGRKLDNFFGHCRGRICDLAIQPLSLLMTSCGRHSWKALSDFNLENLNLKFKF